MTDNFSSSQLGGLRQKHFILTPSKGTQGLSSSLLNHVYDQHPNCPLIVSWRCRHLWHSIVPNPQLPLIIARTEVGLSKMWDKTNPCVLFFSMPSGSWGFVYMRWVLYHLATFAATVFLFFQRTETSFIVTLVWDTNWKCNANNKTFSYTKQERQKQIVINDEYFWCLLLF